MSSSPLVEQVVTDECAIIIHHNLAIAKTVKAALVWAGTSG